MNRALDDNLEAPQVNSANMVEEEARILVVDDEENLRITTAAILEKDGYVVDVAASGDEAISLLKNIDYDLVLTDLHMEGGDGLSVLNQIRHQSPFTIAVVLTGFHPLNQQSLRFRKVLTTTSSSRVTSTACDTRFV